MMKNLLPDTIAARAMALLVIGLAATHLLSNIFYATDRNSALLNAGGDRAIQWIATIDALSGTLSPEDLQKAISTSQTGIIFATLTDAPAVQNPASNDWREAAFHDQLKQHLDPARADSSRIAYVAGDVSSPALEYWRNYLSENGLEMPQELVVVSLETSGGKWINVASPIQTSPRFFSKRLALSTLVMLIAVIAISAVIVRRMTDPLTRLSQAAEKLGTDVRAPAIPESGPLEVRRTAQAFNVMQSRIRHFVDDRTQMLAAIAHDLGTPITRLRLRAEFVEDDESREKMLRDLDDMQHMVASTLAFIREEATSETPEVVDLGSLLARVCDDIEDTGANVDLSDAPRWVLLECRPAALRRAIGNLVENAVKYGNLARVSLRLECNTIVICVDDDGAGIDEKFLEDAFQPFRRLDSSRNFKIGGTGLGLSVARTIARAHGGDIILQNRSDGGLRAELRLPLSIRSGELDAGSTGKTQNITPAPPPGDTKSTGSVLNGKVRPRAVPSAAPMHLPRRSDLTGNPEVQEQRKIHNQNSDTRHQKTAGSVARGGRKTA